MAISNALYDLMNLILTLIVAYTVKFYYSWYTRENPLPGPIPLPIIGNLHQIGLLDIRKGSLKLQKKYGDIFEVLLGSKRSVFVNRADLLEKVFSPAIKNNTFIHRISQNTGLDELGLTTNGITFNKDLSAWKFNMSFLTHTIMSPKFLRENVGFTNKTCDELEKYWIRLGPKTKINFPRWTACFAVDLTLSASTGKKSYASATYYNSLSNSDKAEIQESFINESSELVDSIYKFVSSIMFFSVTPDIVRHYFPIIKPLYKEYKNNNEWLDVELEKIINKRKQEIENTPPDEPIEHNILNLLITTNTKRGSDKISGNNMRPMTDNEIRGALKEIFAGGMDTIRNASCFILYYVLKHPDVKDKLIKEYESVYGDSRKKLEITHESLDKLVYTEAVIKEATRLQSPIPLITRAASSDTEIGGYKIKKGTDVFINVLKVHSHENHWDEPEKFNPDRFLKEKIVKNSYLTFGGGVRICPGRHWAMKNMKILFVRLLTKFDVTL
ncbi:cytochrome P450, partial [Glomus cerebriforme]